MLPGVFATKYENDMAIMRTKTHWFLLVALLAFLFTIPLYCSSYWLTWFITVFVWIIAVVGLHMVTGLCGLFSVAQAAFMAVGAYATAIFAMRYGLSWWATLPLAAIAGGLAGLIIGLPALRIRGFYFAMSTLAASFIIVWMIGYFDGWTGGVPGMFVQPITLGGIDFSYPGNYFYLAAVLTIIMVLFGINIHRTRLGRAFVAVRDNELAAQVMGINLFRYKTAALLISTIFAGVAGWLWAYFILVISPEQFDLGTSIWMIGALMIGGMGSMSGPVLGAVMLKLLDILSDQLATAIPNLSPTLASHMGIILYSLVIGLFIIFEPRGLYHRWQMFKSAYRLFPYSY